MSDKRQARVSPATLRDVAREAGVSASTASRALNGSARSVQPQNVARVLAAAAKLEYEPHLSAQAIATGSTRTAALIVGDVVDPYFSTIAAGVSQAANAAGLIVAMASTGRSPERELEIVRTLRGHRPRAIVLAGSRIDGGDTRASLIEELTAYQRAGGHVAMVSQHDLPFATVTLDNRGGARALARSLVARGYRRFAVIRAEDAVRTSRERSEGFMAGLREAGVNVDDRHVVRTDFTRDGSYRAARDLTARGIGDVEVVFAVNDVMAIGAMSAFRDSGLVPGEDIGVAGFDDIAAASDVTPALTTVAVPLHEAGRAAIRMALRGDTAQTVCIPGEVVLRESTPLAGSKPLHTSTSPAGTTTRSARSTSRRR